MSHLAGTDHHNLRTGPFPSLATAEKLEGEKRDVLLRLADSLCFTENKGTHGVGAPPQKKLKPSFAPEDKPLVRKLLALLPE